MPGGEPASRALRADLARRREAALAGHRGDVATARRLLADSDPKVRAAALGALVRCERLKVADLVGAIGDASPEVRARAAEVAAAWPGDAPPSLRGLLSDADPTVVEAAAWASGERQPPEPGIVEALAVVGTGHDEPLCREAAIAALGAIGDPAGLPAILAATRDRPAIRRRAVLALAPFDGPQVDEALARARSDRDWQVRQAAEDLTR
jgi:HEAT repeat protein